METFIDTITQFFAMRDWNTVTDIAVGITAGMFAWGALKWLGSLFTIELPSGSYRIGDYIEYRRAYKLPPLQRPEPTRSAKMADLNSWSPNAGNGHVSVME